MDWRGLVTGFKKALPQNQAASDGSSLVSVVEPAKELTMTRQDIVVKLLSTLLGLTTSFVITYFGVKWLVNAMDPTHREKKAARKRAEELLKTVGVEDVKLSDYELCIAANIVDTLTIEMNWEDIGGLDSVIGEIKESVILPFRERHLFSDSVLLQPPKGVLLYGPPGCGKTMLAKATAKATGAKFINLQVSSLVDKWYGESQKRAEAVFSLAVKLQPTIIFIDEIDSFLRSRSSSDHEATAMIKTQFMSFWDGLITDPKCHVMIMGATNRPNDVDAAILRRMPCMFRVGLPGKPQRQKILEIIMQKEKIAADVNFEKLAGATEEFSGSDLRETCRIAAINRIRVYLVANDRPSLTNQSQTEERLITMSDLTLAVGKMRQTKLSAIRVPVPLDTD